MLLFQNKKEPPIYIVVKLQLFPVKFHLWHCNKHLGYSVEIFYEAHEQR